MRSLEIVLRTCDRSNVHVDWRERYCNLNKKDLLTGCVNSLVNSINNTKDIDIKLTILDDNSSADTIKFLSKIPNSTLVRLTKTGYNHSAHQQWLACRDTECDLFYSIEDDYLHSTTAIQEMVDSYYFFNERLKHDNLVLYPFDEPSEYNPPARKDFIVHGSARHWRTGIFTTQVMMSKPALLKEYWTDFETLALKYNGDYLNPRAEHYEESNTIWPIWNSGPYIRFNPIPSLALHLQFDQQKDPFINWQQWWEIYTKQL